MTVYLDSANWDDLAENRVSGELFERAAQNGLVVPVLSAIHLFELSRRDKPFRQIVAGYIDRINEIRPICWIKNLAAVIENEIQSGFLSVLNITPVAVKVFADNLADTIPVPFSERVRLDARCWSVTELVESWARPKAARRYEKFRSSQPMFNIAQLRTIRARSRHSSLINDLPYLLKANLPGRVVTPSGLEIEVTTELLDQFSRGFEPAQCPAFSAMLGYFDGWSLTSGGEEPSNFEDLFHLVALGYCDVMFADKRTCDALSKVKMTKLPRLNSKFSDWVASLNG